MRVAAPGAPRGYSYEGMTYSNPDAPTQIANGVSTTTFSYDADGNLAQKTVDGTTTTYVWDYANRLTALGVGGATTTYSYGALGNNRASLVLAVSGSCALSAQVGDTRTEAVCGCRSGEGGKEPPLSPPRRRWGHRACEKLKQLPGRAAHHHQSR
jgi:YD repeat-containing protein